MLYDKKGCGRYIINNTKRRIHMKLTKKDYIDFGFYTKKGVTKEEYEKLCDSERDYDLLNDNTYMYYQLIPAKQDDIDARYKANMLNYTRTIKNCVVAYLSLVVSGAAIYLIYLLILMGDK